MKVTIKNLDPTGVEVEAKEFEIPLIKDITSDKGVCRVAQEDGTIIVYEPARMNRYFLYIGGYIYQLNQRTGELTLIKKGED